MGKGDFREYFMKYWYLTQKTGNNGVKDWFFVYIILKTSLDKSGKKPEQQNDLFGLAGRCEAEEIKNQARRSWTLANL